MKGRKKQGKALIINIEDFIGKPKKGIKDSTDDALELKHTLEELDIQVELKENLKHEEFIKTVEDFAMKVDIQDASVCVLCFISHGNEEAIESSDNIRIDINKTIFNFFLNISCPKLLLIQAYRGHEDSLCSSVVSRSSTPFSLQASGLQNTAIAYFVIPHYVAKELMDGAPFIKIVSDVFREYSNNMDIAGMLVKVQQKIKTLEFYGNKVVCEVVNNQIKDIYFIQNHKAYQKNISTETNHQSKETESSCTLL